MRILILGDSLTLPRYTPEVCLYVDTWPVLLKKNYDVHPVSIGGGTIRDLHRQLDYHVAYEPDIVIIQSGIVDCAPRALGKMELEVMQQLWFTKRFILPIIKKKNKLLRKIRNKVYTTPQAYAHYAARIKKALPKANIYALGILPVNNHYEEKVPGIGKRVDQFNGILKKQFGDNFISLNTIDTKAIMSDHIHLNKDGHQYVYDELLKKLTAS